MLSAIDIDELAHETMYPNDVATLAMRQTIAIVIIKYDHPSRRPIIGYAIAVKTIGINMKSGSSAIVFPKK